MILKSEPVTPQKRMLRVLSIVLWMKKPPCIWDMFMSDFQNRCVAIDELDDGVKVSTVFLGMDFNHLGGPPVLWETMIFGLGGEFDYQKRYTSLEDALNGHQRALTYARDKLLAESQLDDDER
jgi:hypothetical protein